MDATKHGYAISASGTFCRLCLKTDAIEIVVQSPEEANESLLNIISECLGIWLTVTEDFPLAICHSCSMSMEAIRQFRYNCQQCDFYLRSQRSAAPPPAPTPVLVVDSDLDSSTEHKPLISHSGMEPAAIAASQGVVAVQEVRYEESTISVSDNNGVAGSMEGQMCEQMVVMEQHPVEMNIPLKKFDCPECGKQLYSSRMLAQHVVREHRLCHGCDQCGMSYNSKQKLDSHKESCSGRPSKFICTQCPSAKVFATAISLSMHLYYAHDSIKSVVYRCEACKKNFKNRTGLKYHYNARHGCTMVECEICRRPFPTEESLYYHKQADH
ncbi:GDNF-inducible zinc finger protein 1-like [Ochlerotatus camptorhynchus]|uniref:GDNF-inducible zinc finger protein 1-like n=1 Tax=Ochlerotatus camptorhynchus TaxID=644619 RepID=UPI0031CE86B3